MKKIFALIIAIGFVGSASLSFFAMNHSQMDTDCTMLPGAHLSICGGEMSSAATHYISMYQSFTNVLVAQTVTQVLAISALFLAVAYVARRFVLLELAVLFSGPVWRFNFFAKLYQLKGITRWLSLLLNSPSLV